MGRIILYGAEQAIFGADGKGFFNAFKLSSAFPFVKDTLFFPKPLWLSDDIAGSDIDKKKIKQIKYFDKPTYENLLQGQLKGLIDANIQPEKTAYYTEHILSENQPYISKSVQRVTVDRTGETEGNTFYTDRLYFSENCGLFFIIDFNEEHIAYRSIVASALRLLGDNGIGSDKSVGNGQFEFDKFESFDFNLANNGNKQIALSLYCPEQVEIQNEEFLNQSAYNLIKRGGYIGHPQDFDHSTLRKKSILMFTEGSVFPNVTRLNGKIVDLKPDNAILIKKDIQQLEHPIYRDGQALFLPYVLSSINNPE